MFNNWFLITLTLTSHVTLILSQTSDTPLTVCAQCDSTETPFYRMTQSVFTTCLLRYCTSAGITVGRKGGCQLSYDCLMRVNRKTQVPLISGLLQRREVNPASLKGRDNRKPQFTQKGSDPELRYYWQGRKYLVCKHWLDDRELFLAAPDIASAEHH